MPLTEQDRDTLMNVMRAINDASAALAYSAGRLLEIVERNEHINLSDGNSASDNESRKGKGKGKEKGKDDRGNSRSRSPRRDQVIGARPESILHD